MTGKDGRPKGCGRVEFACSAQAEAALAHGRMELDGQRVVSRPLVARGQGKDVRPPPEVRSPGTAPAFTKVFVAGLDWGTKAEHLEAKFAECGPVLSSRVLEDASGKCRGCGFVEFRSAADAAAAVERLHQSQWRGERPPGAREAEEAQARAEAAEEEKLMKATEKRVDPADDATLTYAGLKAKYEALFSAREIREYWSRDCKEQQHWEGHSHGGGGDGW